jgi:alpha-galactosidase
MRQDTKFSLEGLHFTCSIDIEGATAPEVRITARPSQDVPDTHLIRIAIGNENAPQFALKRLSLIWDVPATDMHGFIGPGVSPDEMVSLPFWRVRKRAGANTNVPFVALINRNRRNRYAFGLMDQVTETALDAELSELTRSYHFNWHKPAFSDQPIVANHWEETLFVSLTDCPWPEVLRAYVATVDQLWGQAMLPVPEHAFGPVFCTWTAIHHDVTEEWILRNARLAADLGFETWITDDGWFTDRASFADYRYTGDWEPCKPKFPNFRSHVRAVQALGMRYVLWIAPFMVGDESRSAEKYAHLLTGAVPELHFSNLSPWHDETARHIGDVLERLVTDYGLDGLKIDFIDSIRFGTERKPGASDMSLGRALYSTLREVSDRLTSHKPDLLIEFRNSYANLASRRYANIYRSSDVPINFTLNRWQVTMLRLLAPDRAIHFDPALWHPDDSDENVAVHLINAIISVPMVSIELDRYPQNHHRLIRYWIGFYRDHRDTIIHGKFQPEFLFGHVALIRFVNEQERIIGVYSDVPFAIEGGPSPLWVLNASSRPYVEFLPSEFDGTRSVVTRDKFGQAVKLDTVTFPWPRLDVEVGGSLEII